MKARFLAPLLMGTVVGTAHSAKPQIQWDESYDFDAVSTYQWRDTDSPLAASNPLLNEKVMSRIETELTNAGLMKAEQDPDVYVTYHTTTEENVRLDSDSYGYGFGGYGGPGWGGWGYAYNGPVSTTTNVVTYDTNTLIVDIVDADRQELVWRASYSRVFSDDAQKAEKQLDSAIEAMAKRWQKLQK